MATASWSRPLVEVGVTIGRTKVLTADNRGTESLADWCYTITGATRPECQLGWGPDRFEMTMVGCRDARTTFGDSECSEELASDQKAYTDGTNPQKVPCQTFDPSVYGFDLTFSNHDFSVVIR
jgi:hypothetical protein